MTNKSKLLCLSNNFLKYRVKKGVVPETDNIPNPEQGHWKNTAAYYIRPLTLTLRRNSGGTSAPLGAASKHFVTRLVITLNSNDIVVMIMY